MGKGKFPIERLQKIQTPFYYYDSEVLRQTLKTINEEAGKHEGFVVHYAVKANANPKILRIIREAGLGADCVSGGEIEASIKAGFPASKIVYAGVGKADWEINLGLENEIFCFNVESIPELEVINELAAKKGKVARVAFRLNPNVGAHTHANITTGLAENKFGIAMRDMLTVIDEASKMANVKFVGLHFHIGSQILDMGDFQALCNRVNELQDELERHRIHVEHINVGGGLGVDYEHPNRLPIPDFKAFFDTYANINGINNSSLFESSNSIYNLCSRIEGDGHIILSGLLNIQFIVLCWICIVPFMVLHHLEPNNTCRQGYVALRPCVQTFNQSHVVSCSCWIPRCTKQVSVATCYSPRFLSNRLFTTICDVSHFDNFNSSLAKGSIANC